MLTDTRPAIALPESLSRVVFKTPIRQSEMANQVGLQGMNRNGPASQSELLYVEPYPTC